MTHERAQELLLELSYGELEPAEAREVERHVAACAECAAEWQRQEETRRALRRLGDPRPERGRDRILAAARAAVATSGAAEVAKSAVTPPRPRGRSRATWTVAIATAAVLTVVAGVTLKLADLRPAERGGAHLAEPPREAPAVFQDAPAREEDAVTARAPAPQPAAPPASRAEGRAASGDAPTRLPAAERSPPRERAASRVDVGPASPAAPRAAPDAPSAAAEAPAPTAGRAAASLSAVPGPAAASRALVAAIEARIAAQATTQQTRPLTCDGEPATLTTWADGGRAVKVRLVLPAGVLERWYDSAGRLRAARAGGESPESSVLTRHLDERGAAVQEKRSGELPLDLARRLDALHPAGALPDGCTSP